MSSIKYAEITIIRNLQEESILNYFNRLLGNENNTNENDTIIILFDDETISDVKIEYNNKLKLGPTDFRTYFPSYIIIKDKPIFYYKSPNEVNGIKKLNFRSIFANNKKHLTTKKETSIYNIIYYNLINNNEVFAIIKIKSNEEKPRYLLAYDDKYFEKDDIIYLVNYIFSLNN